MADTVSTENFKAILFEEGKRVMQKANGAGHVLNALFPKESADALDFATHLLTEYPKRFDVTYISQGKLPSNTVDTFHLHLSDLSWFSDASTKPSPYLVTCLSLWDEIITHGFQSQGWVFSSCTCLGAVWIFRGEVNQLCCRRSALALGRSKYQ